MPTESFDRFLRVLVVNGSRDGAHALSVVMESWGYQTRVVYTGLGALAIAHAFRPDVVVADICLPGMDGFQLASSLRGQAVMIALTSLGQKTFRRRAFEAGFQR